MSARKSCGDGSSLPDQAGTNGSDLSSVTVTVDVLVDGPTDGNFPASGDAAESVGPAAAAHCGAAHYSCCRVHLRSRPPAANGREPRIPD